MSGEGGVLQLGGAQLGLITGFAACIAGLQILRDLRRLSKRQNRRESETKTGYLPKILSETSLHVFRLLQDSFHQSRETSMRLLVWPEPACVPASHNRAADSFQCSYFASSFASAILACWPASETAFRKASALRGVAAFPERMLRNIMCLP